MRAYVKTTGVLFALIALAHIWRLVYIEPQLATDPLYLLLTVLAAALAFWAARLVLTVRGS